MATARRVDTEEYLAATSAARAIRAVVAEQLHDSLVERDEMSGRSEVAAGIERLLFVERRLAEALGRQKQARVEGMPVGRAVADEREMRSLLREAVMGIAVACGGWVAAMDYEQVAAEVPRQEEPEEPEP